MSKSNFDAAWAWRERVVAAAACALLGAVLVTSHAVSGAFAKYTAGATSSDEARVAVFGHSETVKIGELPAKPGESATTTLTVSNSNGAGQVSEVAQEYEIGIETAGNLPLEFKLADSAGNEIKETLDAKMSGRHLYTGESWSFSSAEARTDTYTLTVTWSADKNDDSYANIPDYVQVNINVTQID